MSYDVSLRGKPDLYTISDAQGEELKRMLKEGKKHGFVEFGALLIQVDDIKSVEYRKEPVRAKDRLLDQPAYQRTPAQIKSMRELIYKHTKDLKEKGVLPKDKIFDVEREFENHD